MNKEKALQAKNKVYDAISASILAYEKEEAELSQDRHLPALRAILAGAAGGQVPAAPGEGQAAAPDPTVGLNVGKECFEVQRDWLTAIPGSWLGMVFEQGWDQLLPRDEQGAIFLDLEPQQFGGIMRFLEEFVAAAEEDNLPAHPETGLSEEAKWGLPGLLEMLGLGCLGTAEEARALGTKRAFLEKKQRQEAEAVRGEIKEPVAEKFVQAMRPQLELLQQNQPLQVDTTRETIGLFEALIQWDRALADRKAASARMEKHMEQGKQFLQHLAGCGAQEEGRREPPRIVCIQKQGGAEYLQTLRSTLSQCPVLAAQLGEVRNEVKKDKLRLKYDESAFKLVAQFLRMRSLGLEVPPLEVLDSKRGTLAALLEELGLALPAPPVPPHGSLILNEAQYQRLMQELQTVGVRQLRLLYRGTRDGFTDQSFHQRCDNQGRTVTLCKSQQHHLFGGYSDIPWDQSNQSKQSHAAFLFKVGHLEQVAFSRHNVVQHHQHAICCYPASSQCGPAFGGGHDLLVTLNGAASVNINSFGHTYDKGPGNVSHLAEGTVCPLQELEVFAAS